jgi:bifunctional non-homologous end joining protein LigD
MLATPGRALPAGDDWALEPKYDGWRALAHVTPDGPRIFTRHGEGHHRRLPALNAALAELPLARSSTANSSACNRSRADGCAAGSTGSALSGFMIRPGPHRPADGLTVTLVAFDALAIAGADLRTQPWHQRRERLERLLGGATGPPRLTPVLDASAAVHDALVRDGWEGTVAKRVSSRYRCGKRTNAWLRLKSPAAIERDRMRVASALRPAA